MFGNVVVPAVLFSSKSATEWLDVGTADRVDGGSAQHHLLHLSPRCPMTTVMDMKFCLTSIYVQYSKQCNSHVRSPQFQTI
jgi:hypothetical protein